MIVLITGPVRSGKSTHALAVARTLGAPVTHVVTARVDPADVEMAERIRRHRAERGDEATHEVWNPGTFDLPALVAAAPPQAVLLVDSLGTWVAGQLLDLEELALRDPIATAARLDALAQPLMSALERAQCHIVLVAEETGWGVVPPSAQGRIFRDHLGRLAQRIGRIAQRVELVVAGFALDLRRYGAPVE